MLQKEKALLQGSVGKTYLSYLLPTVIGMLTNSVYCLVDVIFIGTYTGGQGLAALNIAMPVFTIYSSIGLLLGVGGATAISVLIGQGEKQGVDQMFTLTVFLSLAIGLAATLAGLLGMEPFAVALGATPELLPDVLDYLFPIQLATVPYILNNTMQVLIRADYNPKLVMAATVTGNALNILLDWVFVGLCGFGLTGAATSTAIGPCAALAILSFHYICRKHSFHFVRKFFHWQMLRRIFKNGLGTFILEFSAGIVIVWFNYALLRVSGQDAVAIYAVISNIAYVGKGIFNGISQAAQPLISVNYGAAQFRRLKQSLRAALFAATVFAAICFGLILLFPEPVVGAFIGDSRQLLEPGVHAARLYFTSLLFTAVNSVLMYYFQSAENIRLTMFIALLRGFVLIAAGLCIFPPLLGENGIWLTITFAEAGTLLAALPFKHRFERLLLQRFSLQLQKE